MPWNGYNYEDSILISERIVKDDVFTSIHIEEFEVMARDTKLGPEDITRDIPNVGEEALRNLDEAGIVYIGAEVEPGDILCGKITPKGESPMTPEEKLLRAIFGEKASDVRDTSLRLPPGVSGTVVEVRVFNRHGIDIDDRTRAIQTEEKERLKKDADDERGILNRATFSRLKEMLLKQVATAAPKAIKKGSTLDEATLEGAERHEWWKIAVKDDKRQADIEALKAQYDEAANVINRRFEDRVEKLERGDELPPGVLKMVKVFVAVKRKLQPGDKMAGRHGNKGVISRILPIEDMPFLEDGTHADIVLNPLGVPSAHERRADLRDPPRLGFARPRPADPGDARRHARARQGRRRQGRQGDPRQAQGHLRRRLRQGDRRSRRRSGDGAGVQPHRRRPDGHAGVRRRPRSRTSARCWRRPGSIRRARSPCSTAAPAIRSIAR